MGENDCPSCGRASGAGAAYCAHCGARLTLAAPVSAPLPYAMPASYSGAAGISPEPTHAHGVAAPPYPVPSAAAFGAKPPVSRGMAIAALVVNILVWPGLGSLIAGEGVGWFQGFLALAGAILMLVLIGIPIWIAAWVWGLVTGIRLIERSAAAP